MHGGISIWSTTTSAECSAVERGLRSGEADNGEGRDTDRKLNLAPAGGALDGVKVARADATVVNREVDVVLALRLEGVVDQLELSVLRAVGLQGVRAGGAISQKGRTSCH